jgi:hypothetical protein
MSRHRQLALGVILLITGLVVIALGAIFPSSSPLVALGWLFAVPSLFSLCGAVFVVVSLARSTGTAKPCAMVNRIISSGAVAGLGLALGWGAAGALSQVPDWLAGLNGSFVSGSALGISAFVLAGIGLATGLMVGALVAILWWSQARRSQARRSPSSQ